MRLWRRWALALMALCGTTPVSAESILFVGNSYTNQSWAAIKEVLAGHHLEKHVRGGAKLTGWAGDAN